MANMGAKKADVASLHMTKLAVHLEMTPIPGCTHFVPLAAAEQAKDETAVDDFAPDDRAA